MASVRRGKGIWLFLGLLLLETWWFPGCALREPLVRPEGPPSEEGDCQLSRLQGELLWLEKKLLEEGTERPNHLTRAARLAFLLGELSPKSDKPRYFAAGRDYALILVRDYPGWAEGHYWLALNLCGLAELGGPRQGLSLITEIIAHLEEALKVNPFYDQAGPHRVLGRIYFECPPWPMSLGDIHASCRHLRQAVALAPENSTNHLYLAETLWKLGKAAEARQQLQEVLGASHHALCPRFLKEDQESARELLIRWFPEECSFQARQGGSGGGAR